MNIIFHPNFHDFGFQQPFIFQGCVYNPNKKCQRPITPTANRLQEHLGWKLFYLQRRNLQKLHCRQSIRITVGSGWKGSFSTKKTRTSLHFLSKLPAYAIHMARHHCWFSKCFKASKYQYCSAGGTKVSSNPDLICPFASFNNLWRHARMLGTGICRGSCIQTSKSLATTSPWGTKLQLSLFMSQGMKPLVIAQTWYECTCTKKNFDTILIHIPSNARVQSLAHCRFTTKWLWQWGTKLTSSSCCWKYVIFTCPNIPGLSPCQPWTRCHTLGHHARVC